MGLAASAMLSGLLGCGGAITFTIKGTPKSPEVDGKVICEPLKDNYLSTIKVDLEHLAPADRLGGRYFVVWAKDEKGKWNRVGVLKYDEKDRKGTLEGASAPATSFEILISIEKEPTGDAPSGEALYNQKVN
jgi:hypothetical protein